jgi:hypothetical protein
MQWLACWLRPLCAVLAPIARLPGRNGCMYVHLQTHKEEHNKMLIINITIQNKLRVAQSNKQGKQGTAHKVQLVTLILNRPIRSRVEAPTSNPSQHTKRCPMHQVVALTQTYLSCHNAAATEPDLLTLSAATASAPNLPRIPIAAFPRRP